MMFFFFKKREHEIVFFFFSSRRLHTRFDCDWSSDVCSSDLGEPAANISFFTGRREFHGDRRRGCGRRVIPGGIAVARGTRLSGPHHQSLLFRERMDGGRGSRSPEGGHAGVPTGGSGSRGDETTGRSALGCIHGLASTLAGDRRLGPAQIVVGIAAERPHQPLASPPRLW